MSTSTPTLSFPNLTVSIQPSEGDAVHFLRCAPAVAGDEETGLLNLRLRITNKHTRAIRFGKIRVSVVGSNTGAQEFVVSLPGRGELAVNGSVSWNQADDHVFAIPETPVLKLEIFADGIPRPHITRVVLEPHANPTRSGNFRFWGNASDLAPGEYWQIHGTSHGQTRSQMFAYDVGVAVGNNGGFDKLKPNVNRVANWGSENEHYRIWGKPIYAVAAGEVRHFSNDFPGNERPSDTRSPDIQARIDAVDHGNGNFFTIATGDETVLYAHMQQGTLNEEITSRGVGAEVNVGEFLGLAGNSGQSDEPHLHIHSNLTNTGNQSWDDLARPMVFRHASAVAWSSLRDFDDTPWVRLGGRGMPTTGCAVWPGNAPLQRPNLGFEATIDPLALILTGSVYVDLTLPDPPPFAVVRDRVREMIRKMSPDEKQKALIRLKSIGNYHKELERELGR